MNPIHSQVNEEVLPGKDRHRQATLNFKKPKPVKQLIDKALHQLSRQLRDKVGHLEREIDQLQTENASLRNRLFDIQ